MYDKRIVDRRESTDDSQKQELPAVFVEVFGVGPVFGIIPTANVVVAAEIVPVTVAVFFGFTHVGQVLKPQPQKVIKAPG